MNRKIYLASSSVWRASILKNAGINVDILPPSVDEYSILADHPIQTAKLRAIAKGESVLKHCTGNDILISADQVVYLGEDIFDKPKTEEEWFDRLCRFRGIGHDLTTAVSLFFCGKRIDIQEHTKVWFRADVSDQELRAYITDGEARGCAGGYMVEQKGAWLIERVQGDWLNVVGLPLFAILTELRGLGLRQVGWRE
ncbi:MAG: septum formation protein Maf [Deltaproteobacteria bacterium]|nr:septum formation protein Maf [Deltaproteobacteria bacterium]